MSGTPEGAAAASGGPLRLTRRPLAAMGVCFAAGVAVSFRFPVPLPWPPVFAVVALLAVAVAARLAGSGWRWTVFRCASALLATACTGWAVASLSRSPEFRIVGADARAFAGERIEVTGVVAGDSERSLTASGRAAWVFLLQAEEVRTGNGAHRGAGTMRVTYYGEASGPGPRYGERWTLAGRLTAGTRGRPVGRFRLRASDTTSRRLSVGNGSPFAAFCYRAREEAGRSLSVGIADDSAAVGVVRALMLGYREDLNRELSDLFVSTGTLHIFAISGSHVVLVAAMVLLVVRAARVPRLWWGGLLIPLLGAYTVAVGAEASAVRACLMACLFWLAPVFKRRPDALSTLGATAIAILAVDPGQVSDAGFVFSFVAVLGLVVLAPVFERAMRPLWAADPLRVQPEPRWKEWVREGGRATAALTAMTVAAWLATTPLTAAWFGRLTPVALAGNLFVAPLTVMTMLAGSLSIVVGSVAPFLAGLFNHAAWALIQAMLSGLRLLDRLPYGNMEVAPWGWGLVGCWYGVLALFCLLAYAKEDGQRRMRGGRLAVQGAQTGESG
jgi:ComEC/Rec2-related protein